MHNRRLTSRTMYEVEKELKNTQFEICYHHRRILQQQICGPVTADCRVAKTAKRQPAKISVTDDDPSSTICLTVNESDGSDVKSMISIVANNNHQQQPLPLSTTTRASLLPRDSR